MRKPYYKKSHKCWYVTDSRTRREIKLHPDKELAYRLWESWLYKVNRISTSLVPCGGLLVNLPVYEMPSIPSSFTAFDDDAKANMPLRPGVYVVIDENRKCKYVGQAKILRRRLTAQQHCNIDKSKDLVSWVEVPVAELNLVECYLIGMLRPYANFSANRTAQRHAYYDRRGNPRIANCVDITAGS